MGGDSREEAGRGGDELVAGLSPEEQRRARGALRPVRPGLAGQSGTERLNRLLEVPHPERFVPSLPTEELYFFLQDIGLEDCVDLVRYASPEQLAGFVDLGCWRRDVIDVDRLRRWLAIAEENGPEHVVRFLESLDPELVLLFLMRTTRIWDAREAPEDLPDSRLYLPSPDGSFSLEMEADDDRLPAVRTVLNALYGRDLEKAHALLQAARWELPSQLEESCYQWRVSRLEEMGFPPADDAVLMEQDADLDALAESAESGVSLCAGEERGAARPPQPARGWFLTRMPDGPLLVEVLAGLSSDEARERALSELVHVVNRRLALRGLDLGEWSLLEAESSHVFRMSSIGLEWLARRFPGTAAELLEAWPLLAFYRVGRTLLARLQRRARTLDARAALRPGHSPFEPPLELLLSALQAEPPLRYAPPESAGPSGARRTGDGELFQPFATLSEVETAETQVAGGEAILLFFVSHYAYGPERLEDEDLSRLPPGVRAEIRFSSLLLTGIANRVLGRARDLTPLSAEDARDFAGMVLVERPEGRRLDPRIRRAAQEQLLPMTGRLGESARHALERFVDTSLATLEETFAGLPPDETPDPRFLGDVVLVVS